MKKQFLEILCRRLTPLNKNEKARCLNNYNDIITNKIESGISEEKVVTDLGNIEVIANNILTEYEGMSNELGIKRLKYANKLYIILDAIVLFVSYLLTYYAYFNYKFADSNYKTHHTTNYLIGLLIVIPCYLTIYILFNFYSINYLKKLSLGLRGIIISNLFCLIFFTLILYFLKLVQYSRLFMIIFTIITILLEILSRSILFYYTNNVQLRKNPLT